MRHLLGCVCLLSTCVAVAMNKQPLAEPGPVAPINALFDAMRAHDAETIRTQFSQGAQLQRIKSDGQVVLSDIDKFANSIAAHKAYLDEQLLSVTVQQSGNLASVWTPFAFYVDNQLSHCGVNHFVVVNTAGGWRIQHLIDVTHEGDCQAFIAEH
ncbi:hypothetical protein GCM10010982_16180 [Bowmanella pacifica]|uniref:SnoaL-like domain-containing protein n=2 Tax=Bowmanella pacifica TaxID=502051 RepID=A0A917YWA2_9ALTE|nr:hypothetical protein GCM10010982_16180 [Bowmanella pacifica]